MLLTVINEVPVHVNYPKHKNSISSEVEIMSAINPNNHVIALFSSQHPSTSFVDSFTTDKRSRQRKKKLKGKGTYRKDPIKIG